MGESLATTVPKTTGVVRRKPPWQVLTRFLIKDIEGLRAQSLQDGGGAQSIAVPLSQARVGTWEKVLGSAPQSSLEVVPSPPAVSVPAVPLQSPLGLISPRASSASVLRNSLPNWKRQGTKPLARCD